MSRAEKIGFREQYARRMRLHNAEVALRSAPTGEDEQSRLTRGSAMFDVAKALEKLRRYEKAAPIFAEAADTLTPVSLRMAALAYYGLIGSLIRLGSYEKALATVDQLEALVPQMTVLVGEEAHAYVLLVSAKGYRATALERLGRPDEAYAVADQALRTHRLLGPDNETIVSANNSALSTLSTIRARLAEQLERSEEGPPDDNWRTAGLG